MNKLSRTSLSLLVACLGLMANASQASSIRIAAPSIDNLVEEDGSGIYQRMVSRAIESLDVNVQTLFYPYRRAIRAFDAKEVDCIYSFDDVLYQTYQPDQLVSSFPLGKFSFHAFRAPDKPAIVSVNEMVNLRVVGIMGHELYIESVLQGSVRADMVMTEHQAINMLKQGRVDVLIAALPDIQPFISQLSYSPTFSLFSGYDRLNCHNTENNLIFIRELSLQLNRLKNDGSYESLAGEFFVPF
ncbi:hypothetical protein [Saccharospirillum alexandrii]|uniref:hypothetical protein n=1 Tax=Saccharospirillum alexandrii TaxID=2448477 RepID=UPI00373689D4